MANNPRMINIGTLRANFRRLIGRAAVSERAVHQFMSRYPVFIPVHWPYQNIVFSEFQLGNQYRVDFAFAREDSLGVRWHLIEIEKPWNRLFNQKGDPTKEFSHALRQVNDWKTWFTENRDVVLRTFPFKRHMNAIGLYDPEFVLVIGRRKHIEDDRRALARQFSPYPFQVMSFDRLTDRLGIPWYDDSMPLRTCNYANGRMTQISAMRINISYSMV